MQFRLSHLLVAITALCVLLGLLFVSPPILGIPVILFLLALWLPIWGVGITFGQGRHRAFFLGGLMCGLVPCLCAYYHYLYSLDVYVYLLRSGTVHGDLWRPPYATMWWWSHLVLALPWLTGMTGGFAGLLTFRYVTGKGDRTN
jgi:hypothetical protein